MKKQKYTKFEIGQEVALKSSHQTFKNATLIIHTEDDVNIEPYVKCLSITKEGSINEIKIHKSLLEVKAQPSDGIAPII